MKRIALWSTVVILPLLMGAASFGLYHANMTGSTVSIADCCADCPPGCCDHCPPGYLPTADTKIGSPDSECCDDCPPCPWCP
jgi:hypothetical protein